MLEIALLLELIKPVMEGPLGGMPRPELGQSRGAPVVAITLDTPTYWTHPMRSIPGSGPDPVLMAGPEEKGSDKVEGESDIDGRDAKDESSDCEDRRHGSKDSERDGEDDEGEGSEDVPEGAHGPLRRRVASRDQAGPRE